MIKNVDDGQKKESSEIPNTTQKRYKRNKFAKMSFKPKSKHFRKEIQSHTFIIVKKRNFPCDWLVIV